MSGHEIAVNAVAGVSAFHWVGGVANEGMVMRWITYDHITWPG